MKKVLILAAGTCLFGACAMMPPTQQGNNSSSIRAQVDSAWSAVIETMAELNLPIMATDKAAGVITTDWISFKNQDDETGYCACGTTKAPMVDVDRRGKFQIFVVTQENSQQVRVSALFEKVSKFKDIVEHTPCSSTGKLEAEFSKRVSKKFQ
jgi:uncharacterized lipoprotein